MPTIAKVVVENAAYHFDKPYDYLVPDGMALSPGQRVLVPFGRGRASKRMGLVLELTGATGETVPEKLKAVFAPADGEPVLDQEQLRILAWLKQETFCTWFDALKVLPQ